MSNIELATYLETQTLENPTLELESTSPEETNTFEGESATFDTDTQWSSTPSSKFSSASGFSIADTLKSKEKTLRDDVLEQIEIAFKDPKEKLIAYSLTEYLEPTGYLAPDYQEICAALNCNEDVVENVIGKVQQFEPFGVFARTLTECLKIQLIQKGLMTESLEIVVKHLQDFADGQVTRILKKYKISQEDYAEAMMVIQSLNPKPGLIYENDSDPTIVPDVLLQVKGDHWQVKLNEQVLPKVIQNQNYTASFKTTDKEAKRFLKHCSQNYTFLKKALHQRAENLLKVSQKIVERQEGFFRYGLQYLKPMVLREIAKELDLHESTVSRLVSNKYIQTPKGTFELKFFFSSGLSSDSQKEVSSHAVKHRIKSLIEGEDPKHPLSDEDLVKQLKEEGMSVARRTVAKYREAQNIPSSFQRKKCIGKIRA